MTQAITVGSTVRDASGAVGIVTCVGKTIARVRFGGKGKGNGEARWVRDLVSVDNRVWNGRN